MELTTSRDAKRTVAGVVAALFAITMLAVGIASFGAQPAEASNASESSYGRNYVDSDFDGICDNREDGVCPGGFCYARDGVCDSSCEGGESGCWRDGSCARHGNGACDGSGNGGYRHGGASRHSERCSTN